MAMKISAGILVGIVLLFILANGTFLPSKYTTKKDSYDPTIHNMTVAQFQLIQAGIGASSSHNMQPWKISITDKQNFTLHADMTKDLTIIDGDKKQMLISQGTFIERVKQAADAAGINASIDYANIDWTDPWPVIANFEINSNKAIPADQITGATYQNEPSANSNIETVLKAEFASNNLDYLYLAGEDLPKIQSMLRKGNQIESENQEAMEELLSIFRFSKWEKNSYRHGLSLNTASPVVQTFINPILKFTTSWKSFGESSIPVFEKRLENEIGYLLLIKDNPTDQDLIAAGETLARLSGEIDGYILRPAVQVLEDIDGMETVGKEFQDTYGTRGEVIFIIGFTPQSDGYYESVRHQVSDLILPAQ